MLHARLLARRQAAILATAAGTATAVTGIGAHAAPALVPAALLFLGMWWWVAGKYAVETGVLPRAFAMATLAAAPLALACAGANALDLGAWTWLVPRLALAAWLLGLAASLLRPAPDAR